MPKIKTLATSRGKNYISEFSEHIFALYGSVLFCKMCEIEVKWEKPFSVVQHFSTSEKYIRAFNDEIKSKNTIQQPITFLIQKFDFLKDLWEIF